MNPSTWTPSSPVIISSQTGSGKSYFIMNDLYDYALTHSQTILFLVHRTLCLKQFALELKGKEKTITLSSYQQLECADSLDLSNYTYIVCDEFHYFLTDSPFNYRTEISLNKIMESNCIKVFMSATSIAMQSCLMQLYGVTEFTNYYTDRDYSYISEIKFCTEKDSPTQFMNYVAKKKKKGILFIGNSSDAVDLYKENKHRAHFLCSSSSKYHNFCNREEKNSIITEQKFKSRFLITTTVLDAGVNIYDDDVRYIYADITDVDELIQCIGRKRVKPGEKVELWIQNQTAKKISSLLCFTKGNLSRVNEYNTIGQEEYDKRYIREYDPSGVVYRDLDGKSKVNKVLEYKLRRDIRNYEWMLERENGYIDLVMSELGNIKNEIMFDKTSRKNELEKLIEKYLGKDLNTEKRKERFIRQMNVRSTNHTLKSSIEIINQELEKYMFRYKVYEHDGVWRLEKTVTDVSEVLAEYEGQDLYTKEEKNIFATKLNIRDSARRLKVTVIPINKELENRNIPYEITTFNHRKDGKLYHNIWKINKKSRHEKIY